MGDMGYNLSKERPTIVHTDEPTNMNLIYKRKIPQ